MSSFVQLCFALVVCCCMYATADNGGCQIVSSEWTSTSPNDSSCQRKYTLRHCEAKSCNLPGESGKVIFIQLRYFVINAETPINCHAVRTIKLVAEQLMSHTSQGVPKTPCSSNYWHCN